MQPYETKKCSKNRALSAKPLEVSSSFFLVFLLQSLTEKVVLVKAALCLSALHSRDALFQPFKESN